MHDLYRRNLLTTGIGNKLDSSKFVSPQNNTYGNKPLTGGLWSSPFNEESLSTPWMDFCRGEDFLTETLDNGVMFCLNDDAKVYTIDTLDDLNNLLSYCGIEKSYGMTPGDKVIDFEKASLHYDAIYLTDNGQWETRMSRPSDLYGWDMECVLILNFNSIEFKNAVDWRLLNVEI